MPTTELFIHFTRFKDGLVIWPVIYWFSLALQRITWLFYLNKTPTFDRLCRGSLRVDIPALCGPLILISTAQLVRPLQAHGNTLASLTIFPFGIVTHA